MSESGARKPGEPDHQQVSPPSLSTAYRHVRTPRPTFRDLSPTPAPSSILRPASPVTDPRKLVVIGVCSSGKSTLVRNLREHGYLASACAQEHSGVPQLWQRSRPDVLICLDASLHTIRQRGRRRWQQSMLDEQHRRLANARERADLYVHTDGLSPQDVLSRVVTFLNNHP